MVRSGRSEARRVDLPTWRGPSRTLRAAEAICRVSGPSYMWVRQMEFARVQEAPGFQQALPSCNLGSRFKIDRKMSWARSIGRGEAPGPARLSRFDLEGSAGVAGRRRADGRSPEGCRFVFGTGRRFRRFSNSAQARLGSLRGDTTKPGRDFRDAQPTSLSRTGPLSTPNLSSHGAA